MILCVATAAAIAAIDDVVDDDPDEVVGNDVVSAGSAGNHEKVPAFSPEKQN